MAFMAALAVLTMAATAEPYLPALGPVPLRFIIKPAHPLADVASIPVPSLTDSSIPVSAPVTAETSNTIPAVITADVLPAPATNVSATVAGVPTVERPLTEATTSVKAPAAYEFIPALPGMTPQALAEYFQPMPNRTNLSSAVVPLPQTASFIPPVPQTQLSSRATYKIQ